jgi:energy-coupling factor transporter ATP-binding protein EcfA2
LLQSICIQGAPSRYKSLLQAIRASWSEKKVEETKKRLQTIRDELQFRVLISLKEDNIRSLNEANRTTLAHVIESNRILRTQTDHIAKQQEADFKAAQQRHSEIMAAVSQRQVVTHHTIDVTERIKGRLYSPRQDDRSDDIAIAYQRTFNWALQDQTSNQNWSSLTKWLREDGGVYWVSGKAGSGKSTLMKYILHDPRTMQELQWWARGGHLIVGSFYFWNSDAKIQRSQEGLFRSILWQILDQDASCGSELFPDLYRLDAAWDEFPTFHQLRRAFGRLKTLPGTTKIVLIVDGLDEFDAVGSTMTELAELFLSAGTSQNLKALVSSRPLSAFEAAFENQPKLRLHELTSNDITVFVDDRLSKHPQVAELAAQSPCETQALVEEIVYAASGVFLWVKLVVDSLLEGLRNQDTVLALQNRLKKLPKDLEALFEHLLYSIPSNYKLESSQYFQLLRCYNQAPNDTSLSALTLFYADTPENVVLETRVEAISPPERARIEEVMRRKLRSHCVGLLELQPRISSRDRDTKKDKTITQVTQDVTYLHRSVADYLAREEVWREIVRHTKSTSFHAPQALLNSSIMEIKVSVFAPEQDVRCSFAIELWQLVLNAMHFASLIAEATSMTSLALLDDLDEALCSHFKSNPTALGVYHPREKLETWCGTWFDDFPRPHNSQDNFLTFTTEQGLELYVCEKFKQNPKCMKKNGRPLLDYACNSGPRFMLSQPKIVQTLLYHGADPNERFHGQSPWMNMLTACEIRLKSFCLQLSVISEMLQRGADPNISITKRMRFSKRNYGTFRQSVLRHIKWISNELLEGQFVREDDSATTISITEQQFREQQQAMKGLIKLLISKGAKDKEWHNVAGTFTQIGGLRSKSYNLWGRLRGNGDEDFEDNQQRWGRAFLLNDGTSYCKRHSNS